MMLVFALPSWAVATPSVGVTEVAEVVNGRLATLALPLTRLDKHCHTLYRSSCEYVDTGRKKKPPTLLSNISGVAKVIKGKLATLTLAVIGLAESCHTGLYRSSCEYVDTREKTNPTSLLSISNVFRAPF
jgi:hypothetical protein